MSSHSPGTPRALVVEDSVELREIAVRALRQDGFEVAAVADGAEAVRTARGWRPDVIVLDLGLPALDGVEVCRQVRVFSDAYIVMVTSRDDEVDKLIGLSVGADDYLTKPYSTRELVARVRAMLRRPRRAGEHRAIEPGAGLTVDADTRDARVRDTPLDLTRREFDLLLALASTPTRVLPRQELIDRVWGAGWYGDPHVVEVHVSNLRRKLAAAGAPGLIRTVRGIGYRFRSEA